LSPVEQHGSGAPDSSDSADLGEALKFGTRRDFSDCVHCGLCLNACPTYLELGQEPDSPRGRIHLMKALAQGDLDLTPDLVRHFDLCLGCRACEPACPSGVSYGHMIEITRSWLDANHARGGRRSWLNDWVIGRAMTRPLLFRSLVGLTRLAANLGLSGVVRSLTPDGFDAVGWSRRVPMQPRTTLPLLVPAVPPRVGRVALLTGCVMDGLFGTINERTAQVLSRQGWDVHVPRGQVCCGALLVHNGMVEKARDLASRNTATFSLQEVDYVVTNAAGCGAMLKEYGRLMAGTPNVLASNKIASKSMDVSEVLDMHPLRRPLREIPARAVYHDACHLSHAQKVTVSPRSLLRQVPGLELLPLSESDVCCGSAGSYNITEAEMAGRLGRRKAANVLAAGADYVVMGNAGCMVQIEAALAGAYGDTGGTAGQGPVPRVVHTIDLLYEATQPPDDAPSPAAKGSRRLAPGTPGRR
jgi:glycolate oxidase iron-sulfur subunit